MSAVMLDIEGLELTAEDKNVLDHPSVGGLILFSRNYQEPAQLQALCKSIRQHARQNILIAIDHEGGRVQRCREQFSAIPSMASFERYAHSPEEADQWAQQMGWLMATEVLANGIDFSFAPVLDVHGVSEVIGDRAFSTSVEVIERLGRSFIHGMRDAGMSATGKHFPGHGSVRADSHIAVPEDNRELCAIEALDLLPFKGLAGELQGIMPAHVIYPQIDSLPAGFSRHWLQHVLRGQLGFDGVIFSDDLAMEGATVVGSMQDRAELALHAGCDMVLVCNDRAGAVDVLDNVQIAPAQRNYLSIMRGQSQPDWNYRENSASWQMAQRVLEVIRTRADQ